MIEKPKGKKLYRIIDFLHTHIVGVIIVVVIIICGLSMIYVVTDKSKSDQVENNDIQYEDTDTIFFAIHKLKSINPLSSVDDDVYYINQLLYSSLFKLDENLSAVGDLVDNYSTNTADGSVTVTIKSGVKFSDGTRLTTSDIRYTINEIQSIGKSSPYYAYASKIDYVNISSDTKMKIYFESATDAAIDNLVFPIISSDSYTTEDNNKTVGSGLYAYSSYDSASVLKLKPNKYYYGEKATSKVELKVLPNISAATGLMTMDAITSYVNTSRDADSDANDKDLKNTEINSNEAEYLAYNFKNKYLAIKEIRWAIATAINTEAIVNDNYGGTAIASDSIYYPGFLGSENKGDPYSFNQSKSSKILKEAGFVDIDEDGILEDASKNKLAFSLVVNSNDTSRCDAANDIAANLKDIGINITVKTLTWSDYSKALKKGSFDLVLGGYKFDKQYDLRALFNSQNSLGYVNESVMAKVNKMETAIKTEALKANYETLKQELIADLPYYCICYKTYSFVTVKNFESKEIPTFFDRYRGTTTWTWKKAVTTDTASDTYTDDSSSNDSN